MAERYEITLSKLAKRNIEEIIHYLMTNYSHNAALKTTVAINDKIASLATFPEAHPKYIESQNGDVDILYRYVIAKKVHRIVFTVKIENNEVIIATIKNIKTPKATVIRTIEEE